MTFQTQNSIREILLELSEYLYIPALENDKSVICQNMKVTVFISKSTVYHI